MSDLIWWIIGIVLVVFAAAGVAGWLLYRRYAQAALVRLVGYREAVRAAYRAVEGTFAALAVESPDEMLAFASDRGSERRRALDELDERLTITIEELGEMPLPKSAWTAGDLLMAAAGRVRAEIRRVNDAGDADAVLEAIATLDVEGMRTAIAEAGAELEGLLAAAKIKDASVYGGGLYI